MFKIGDFSKLTHVSIRMLRYYDEQDLLKPALVDEINLYRFYSAKQMGRLFRIVYFRDMGFGTVEIRNMLAAEDQETVFAMLADKHSEIEANLVSEEKKLMRLKDAMDKIGEERKTMDYQVELKSVPSYQVVSLREIIPHYDDEGMLWYKLSEYIKKEQLACSKTCFATYHDEGYKEENVDVEVVIETQEARASEGPIRYYLTDPIETAASILVPGEYTNIAPAFAYLGEWIEENGHSIVGNAREVQLHGPWDRENPDDYLTEIQVPVLML
jgi:DNA-binding transcriptional MerR regulator